MINNVPYRFVHGLELSGAVHGTTHDFVEESIDKTKMFWLIELTSDEFPRALLPGGYRGRGNGNRFEAAGNRRDSESLCALIHRGT
jgi:hypothetical protein